MSSKPYEAGVKLAKAALGIPDRKEFGDHTKLKPGQIIDLVIQQHDAERAGRHYDYRIGDTKSGLLSWATKKELPKPGDKPISLFEQPLHSHAYGKFEGEIPEGYGKGTVKTYDFGKLLVTKVTPDSIHYTIASNGNPERFALIKPKDGSKQWLLLNTTKTKAIDSEKIKYKSVSPADAQEVLKNLKPGSSVQAKIDGAAALVDLTGGKLEVASYRRAKGTDFPILYTEKFLGKRPEIKLPKEFHNSLLRGELYGLKDKAVIAPQELGGVLNATIENSLKAQKSKDISLKTLLFDISRLKGKDIDPNTIPYDERKALVKSIMKHLPRGKFEMPLEAHTPNEALDLYKSIREMTHPASSEGVVLHPQTGAPTKIKLVEDYDVHITGIFPGEGKYEGKGAGGFTYSIKPGGETVGRVGTGISDALRKDMHRNPKDYIGRVAKVKAQEQYEKTKALRAPVLLSLHEDL